MYLTGLYSLQDKDKIRHKKRWSQIMYMYYFLGYQIAERTDLSEQQKEYRARRTFCLALDGDGDICRLFLISISSSVSL